MKRMVAFLAGPLYLCASPLAAQLVLDQSQTVEAMVQNLLPAGDVQISNITWGGDTSQFAAFDGSACNIGLASGFLMATGEAQVALGPNFSPSWFLGDWQSPYYDDDLLMLSGLSLFHTAMVEFDLVPEGDTLGVQLVFASEEYEEFVNEGYNDVVGIFLSGPGISGPFWNNAVNIAEIAGAPLSINTVNADSNATLFISNGDGFTSPQDSLPYYVQFDGFTVPLTFRYALPEPGSVYHLKIAIADETDDNWDSAIFIAAGSLGSHAINTGLAEGATILPLRVAPNPLSDAGMISGLAEGPHQFQLFDARGRSVRSWQASGPSAVLPVDQLPAGIYAVHAMSEQGHLFRASFVVER